MVPIWTRLINYGNGINASKYPPTESEVCTCTRRNMVESTLVYVPEKATYEGRGQCDIMKICAILMIEKHKLIINHNIVAKKAKLATLDDFFKDKEECF